MNLPEGDRLQDAIDMLHDHAWRANKPALSVEQTAELLAVWTDWFKAGLLPKRATPKQKVQNRTAPKVDKGSQSQGRTIVAARSGGLCEICALAPAREWHHRKNRSQGGTWAASNGMHLCGADHAYITEHPEQAAANGWTVKSYEDPTTEPVLRRGKWMLLDDSGGVYAMDGEVA
jgi:hypothetical protein